MAKSKTLYQCTECGGQLPKWQGQCPHCSAWNTLVETVAVAASRRFDNLTGSRSEVRALSSVKTNDMPRILTGMTEFDRVLGSGFVPGEVVLLGGDPGIGKSTLLFQAMAALGASRRALYVTGEESVEQVALRAHRLGLINAPVELLAEVQLEAILAALEKTQPEVVVIDSIQTMYTETLSSAPGSVAQVRECAARFTRFAKERGMVLVLIGHVTKEGAIAGPRVLEHIVDAVLYFEGDAHSSHRLIRAMKNRFGAANELGVFGMTEHGLKGVANPSALFLSRHTQPVPGTAVMATVEGSRPLLVEIQALVDPVMAGMMPRRLAVGVDPQRLALLLAVLHRHGGTQVGGFDVFINVVGGVRIDEPAADLAILMAIHSSYKNKALDGKLTVFGEVGLAGEIRPVQRGQERIREAVKLGFKKILIPGLNKPKQLVKGIEIIGISRIEEALSMVA
ncbi:MAG: DNA repair protein RadA [Burkholderiales bacterium]|jgi:DNA repair protein RadA/Sms|nr:DNA repair protein RadA [Burkholderiales bacterium]